MVKKTLSTFSSGLDRQSILATTRMPALTNEFDRIVLYIFAMGTAVIFTPFGETGTGWVITLFVFSHLCSFSTALCLTGARPLEYRMQDWETTGARYKSESNH
jgi:hypothetical protein